MLRKLIALSLVFGLVLADPLPKLEGESTSVTPPTGSARTHNFVSAYRSDKSSYDLVPVTPDLISLILDTFKGLVGLKSTAIAFGFKILNWIKSNIPVIIFGSIITIGFCKITGKCTLDYVEYEPISNLRSMVTPERIAYAEDLLKNAIKNYSEETPDQQ